MTYRDLPHVPIEPEGCELDAVCAHIRLLAKTLNGLLDDLRLMKAQHRNAAYLRYQNDDGEEKGLPISATPPTDGQRLAYDATTETLVWETP